MEVEEERSRRKGGDGGVDGGEEDAGNRARGEDIWDRDKDKGTEDPDRSKYVIG